MTCRPLAVLALVAALAALASLPAVAAQAEGASGSGTTDLAAPGPLPTVTGPLPARRAAVDPAGDALPPDLATLLAQYSTLTHVPGGSTTTLTPPSPELTALLEAEVDAFK